jgi:hypothetical protein
MVRTGNSNYDPARKRHNQPVKHHLKTRVDLKNGAYAKNKPNQKMIIVRKNGTKKHTVSATKKPRVTTTKKPTTAAKKPAVLAAKKPGDVAEKGSVVAPNKYDAALVKKPAANVATKKANAAKKPAMGKKKAAAAKKPAKSRKTEVTSLKKLAKVAHTRSKDVAAVTEDVDLVGAPPRTSGTRLPYCPPMTDPVQ